MSLLAYLIKKCSSIRSPWIDLIPSTSTACSWNIGEVSYHSSTNCGEHAWCTQHDEKKYSMMAAQCKAVKLSVVDSIHWDIGTGVRVYENVPPPKLEWFISRRQFPRLGAFEVYYGNKVSELKYRSSFPKLKKTAGLISNWSLASYQLLWSIYAKAENKMQMIF